MSEFDLEWIVTRLREMVRNYEAMPGSENFYAVIQLTFHSRSGAPERITLTVGAEPADDDDD